MVRLGDVCEINLGKTPPRGVGNCWDNEKLSGNVWVSIADMSNAVDGIIQDSKEYITDYAIEKSGIPVVKEGTLLLSFKLTLGRTAIAGKNLYTNEAIAALPIKPEFSSSIDLDYLITYFSFFDWAGFAASDEKLLGKTLNKKKLAEVPILFPPLSVQRAIVARLEKELGEADKLAAKFKRIAQLADDEFKAELDETFKTIEGEKVRLGDVFEFIDYRGKTPLKTESGVPLITAKNIRQGYLDYHESFYISEKEYATRQTRGIARKGDILFTTEAPLGFVALADKEEFSTGQRVITFQWKGNGERACNKYYLYCLLSDWFQSALWKQATGATAKGIKASRLTNLHVLCVPVSDQEKIVAKLDAAKERCEKLKAVALRGLAAAENLRKAILAEAFEQ